MRVSGSRGPSQPDSIPPRLPRGAAKDLNVSPIRGTYDPPPRLEPPADQPPADWESARRSAESGRGRRGPGGVLPRIQGALVRLAGGGPAFGDAAGRRTPREGVRLSPGVPPAESRAGVLCGLLERDIVAIVPFVRDVRAILSIGMGRISRGQRTLCGRSRARNEPQRFDLDSRLPLVPAAPPDSNPRPGCAHRILPAYPVPAVRRVPSPPVASGGPRRPARGGPDRVSHVRLCPRVPRERLAGPGAR